MKAPNWSIAWEALLDRMGAGRFFRWISESLARCTLQAHYQISEGNNIFCIWQFAQSNIHLRVCSTISQTVCCSGESSPYCIKLIARESVSFWNLNISIIKLDHNQTVESRYSPPWLPTAAPLPEIAAPPLHQTKLILNEKSSKMIAFINLANPVLLACRLKAGRFWSMVDVQLVVVWRSNGWFSIRICLFPTCVKAIFGLFWTKPTLLADAAIRFKRMTSVEAWRLVCFGGWRWWGFRWVLRGALFFFDFLYLESVTCPFWTKE